MIAARFLPLLAIFFPVLILSWIATGLVLRILRRSAILDQPNERSSHALPTPRGGGIAIMTALTPAWIILGWRTQDYGALAILGGALLLAIISWRDDRAGLSPALRLAVQALVVALGLMALPQGALVFQGLLPRWLDLLAAGILWLWFVNLYNFMDGIDGLAGIETACLGLGIAAVVSLHADPEAPILGWPGVVIASAALGFLAWNWRPAKLFMGDVGSVPLGYLLGWLLLGLAAEGMWAPALILPLYYLIDASWTLLRRLWRGAAIWRAHREHFYQRAVQAGLRHDQVVMRILLANLLLFAAALWAGSGATLPALSAAIAIVGLLLLALSRAKAT